MENLSFPGNLFCIFPLNNHTREANLVRLCMLQTACKANFKSHNSCHLCCTDGIPMMDVYDSKS